MASLAAFLHAYLRPGARHGVIVRETAYPLGDSQIEATLYRPARRGRLPGWVVLHGLTYSGRKHPSLIRFVTAVAAAGNAVLVPDIPEWRQLRVAPAVTRETIRSAVRELHERDDIDPDRVGLFGFSFGATQALIAAADPEIQSLLHGIAAWGGYCDIDRLFVFGMTGEHELDGQEYQLQPDPYGAWVMAGNYLTQIPGHETQAEVAAALHELAREAGRLGRYAWEPVYDPVKTRLRETLTGSERELFDIIAPRTDAPAGDIAYRRSLGRALADTVRRIDPGLDPLPFLDAVGVDILLAHGRDDRLIPYTETLRLARHLPPDRLTGPVITALFAHSGGADLSIGPLHVVQEGIRFAGVLRSILRLI
jgi:pimeloyl-ACP methyl ester carboxylesterase